MDYPVVKLMDLAEDEELLQCDNPFAVVVLAHLEAQATRDQPQARLESRVAIARRLYERGYSPAEVVELLRFIDWLLALPQNLMVRYNETLARIEKERQMPYIASFERDAIERGLKKGLKEGLKEGMKMVLAQARKAVLQVLDARFGAVPEELAGIIEQVEDTERLNALHRLAVTVPSVSDFMDEVR